MEYLLKINRTFYFRIAIPKDLQTYFPSKVIKRSLHTTSKTQARKLLNAELYDIQQTFYNLRIGSKFMHLDKPSQQAIDIFKKRYGADVSIHEEAQPGEPCIYGTPWKFKDEVWKIQAKIDAGYIPKEDGFFGLNDAPPRGLRTAALTAPYPIFDETTIEVPVAVPVAPLAPVATVKPVKTSITLEEARKLYIAHCINPTLKYVGKPQAEDTIESVNQALDWLEKYLKTDKILLSDMPKNYYDFAVYLKENGNYGRGYATSSVKVRLNCLSRFLKHLHGLGHIETIPTIVFLDESKEEKLKKANVAYSNEQLNQLFNYLINNKPALFKGRKKHIGFIYLLLGLLHTGCRVTEFIEATEFKEYNGVHVFDISTMTKGVKSSIRYIPLHNRLLQLRFKEYFQKHGFPDDVRNQNKKLSDALITLGIKTANNEYTIHSCRSTFDTKLNGKMPDGLRKRLMGHTLAGMDKSYVEQPADEAVMYQEAVNKLAYDIDYKSIKEFLKTETKYLYG